MIYLASSWRNVIAVRAASASLRKRRYSVYDFTEDNSDGNAVFDWHQVDPKWQEWTPSQFVAALENPVARGGFERDRAALNECDALVLMLPCGKSAHMELGYALGRGIPAAIWIPDHIHTDDFRPELMYSMAERVCLSFDDVLEFLNRVTRVKELSLAYQASRSS